MARPRSTFEYFIRDDRIGCVVLTQGHVALVDAADLPLVAPYKWSAKVYRKSSTIYAKRTALTGETQAFIQMHRFILDAPAGMGVDHIDGDGLNNTRANLRLCSQAENTRNRVKHSNGQFSFKGVAECSPGLFYAVIRIKGRRIRSPHGFRSIEDAARDYDRLATEAYGAFAKLNFPKGEAGVAAPVPVARNASDLAHAQEVTA